MTSCPYHYVSAILGLPGFLGENRRFDPLGPITNQEPPKKKFPGGGGSGLSKIPTEWFDQIQNSLAERCVLTVRIDQLTVVMVALL